MELVINPGKVTQVLLHDGWHTVWENSFEVNTSERSFTFSEMFSSERSFTFIEANYDSFLGWKKGRRVFGPFSSLLVVRALED